MSTDPPRPRHTAPKAHDDARGLFTAQEVTDALSRVMPAGQAQALVKQWYAAEGAGWQFYGEALWNALSMHSPALAARVRAALGETAAEEGERLARARASLPPTPPADE